MPILHVTNAFVHKLSPFVVSSSSLAILLTAGLASRNVRQSDPNFYDSYPALDSHLA